MTTTSLTDALVATWVWSLDASAAIAGPQSAAVMIAKTETPAQRLLPRAVILPLMCLPISIFPSGFADCFLRATHALLAQICAISRQMQEKKRKKFLQYFR
jgi:hypothetical protein